jgi:hypothetical protein
MLCAEDLERGAINALVLWGDDKPGQRQSRGHNSGIVVWKGPAAQPGLVDREKSKRG